VDNVNERSIKAIVATLPKQWSSELNRLIVRSPELERILEGLGRSDASICVVDQYRRVRAVLGGQESQGTLCAETDWIGLDLVNDALNGRQKILHRDDPRTGERLIVAAHPIYDGDGVVGAVLLEKNSAQILALQRETLNHVALATFAVLLLIVAGLLLFGTWLAFRIRRLRREAGAAIDADGRIVKATLESDQLAGDDLGDLSRGVSSLLGRLQRYTGFLETVPRTLRHEMLNPINTISMTLQNLSRESGREETVALIRNALQATRQLEMMVNSLTEAARIEDALKEDVPQVFDLAALVREYVSNTAGLNPQANLVYSGPPSGVLIKGSDLRIAQLLDKVKDNALDFSTEDSQIEFIVHENSDCTELSILNQGHRIPEDVLQALFIGMASCRPHTEGKPHLGIGLFIAKRIASHHGGELTVSNRTDISGVKVTLRIPLVRLQQAV